jgi:hypothetical protein
MRFKYKKILPKKLQGHKYRHLQKIENSIMKQFFDTSKSFEHISDVK